MWTEGAQMASDKYDLTTALNHGCAAPMRRNLQQIAELLTAAVFVLTASMMPASAENMSNVAVRPQQSSSGYLILAQDEHHERHSEEHHHNQISLADEWYQGQRGHWYRENNRYVWRGAQGDEWYHGQRGHWYKQRNGWQFASERVVCDNSCRNCRPGRYLPPNGEGMLNPENSNVCWSCDSEGHHCHWARRSRSNTTKLSSQFSNIFFTGSADTSTFRNSSAAGSYAKNVISEELSRGYPFTELL
jgi:hypothetical protein